MQLTPARRGSRRSRRCRRRAAVRSSSVRSTISRSARPSPSIATGLAKKSKTIVLGLAARRAARSRAGASPTCAARLERARRLGGREVGRIDHRRAPRDGRARPAPWASSRSGAARGGRGCDGADREPSSASRHGRRCPSRRTRRGSWTGCARHRARHCRCRSPPRRRRPAAGEVGEIGMAVIPADERRRADHAGQVVARDAERRSLGAPVARITAS
jgi:hypothetical protein